MEKIVIKIPIDREQFKKELGLKDGYTPIKGIDYFDGNAGSPAIPPDLSILEESLFERLITKVIDLIPTPELIIQSIKELPKEKQISYKDIKDAPEFPRMAGTGYLRELSDVSIQGITAGQLTQWDGKKWIPYTPATISATQIFGEVITPVGSSFTLAHTPIAGTVRIYRGGAYQQAGVGKDYTISGASGLLAIAPDPSGNEVFLADYNY